jgi:CheY-like chemotaxis protein
MISRLLNSAGYDTRIACDPPTALVIAESFEADIAVLDIGLPVMDGYALARELRARMGDAAPQLIALTGYNQEKDWQQSREAGIVLHLAKPVDADDLFHALESVAAARRRS